ncbi:MAG: CHAT domain-containing protein, partial [Verrucomicrobiales bacterium]|nr:CHAT domain-containing protein [Verrucomicrobiales bacterium]
PSQHKLVFTNELANLNQRLGNYIEAEAGYGSSLALASVVTGPETVLVSQLKNNLAALYQVLGRFEVAETLNREALAIREKVDGEGAAATVPAMNNLAGLLWCIGDLDGAETLYREGLKIRTAQLGPDALDTARSRANLGGLLFYQNKIEEAADYVQEAAHVFKIELGVNHPDTLEVLLFLGEVLRATGNPEAALEYYQHVRDGRVEIFGAQPHFETAEAERRLGDARRELGDYEGAMEAYQVSEALYSDSLRPGHPDLIEGLYGAGLASMAQDDHALALEYAGNCSDIELSNLAHVLEFTDERQRLAYQNLFRSHHLFATLENAPLLAEFLLKRKGIVVDSLIAEARLIQSATSPDAVDAVNALTEARARFRRAFLATSKEDVDLDSAREAVRAAHRKLLEITGGSNFGSEFLDLTLADLQAALDPGEVLIDYVTYDRYHGKATFESRVAAVIVSSDNVQFADCVPLSEVEDLIAQTVVFFGAVNPDNEIAEAVLRKLYDTLFKPLSSYLAGVQHLHISPEGALNFVPFACLMDEDGKFIIEHYDLGYVSAARELLKPAQAVSPSSGAFLVGNPKFDTRPESNATVADHRGLLTAFSSVTLESLSYGLAPLLGAEREVQHLTGLLDSLSIPTRSVYGEEATEALLKREAVQPYILHLATHGVYLPSMIPPPENTRTSSYVPNEVSGFQNPLFGSWITLAGCSDTIGAWSKGQVPAPATDGILMANEAAELNLNGTLVVTLSACDTASGEATAGDGVLGVRRGFRMAGAEHVMSTLWPINDAMTPTIMSDFYTGLAQGTPSDSLNEAQRKWLVKIRDDPRAVILPLRDGTEFPVGGLYWAINLAGPFLLSR